MQCVFTGFWGRDMIGITTKDHKETTELGRKIGARLVSGDILLLTGQLGAGKTTLIQGIAEGAGVADFVSSPSFIIVNEYAGRVPLFHADLYRLQFEDEVEDLAMGEYFKEDGIVVVEWAEKLAASAPDKYISINMEWLSENERKIVIDEVGGQRLKDIFGGE